MLKNNVLMTNIISTFRARWEAALSLWAELWQFLLNNHKNLIEKKLVVMKY